MAGISVPQAIVIGVAAPIAGTVLFGLTSKEAMSSFSRFLGIIGVSTFAAAVAVGYFMPAPVAGAVMSVPRPMSVSSSWAQLGRYAGGINYPGQMTGAAGVDGSLIYID
jgi:hypothetical protein